MVPRRLLRELQPWSVLLLAPWEPQLGTADGPWPTRRHHCGGGVQCALEDPPNPGDGLFVERDVAFSALPTGVGPPHSQPMPLRVRCSSWHRLRSGKAVAAEGHCQCFACRACHLQWASRQSGAQGRAHRTGAGGFGNSEQPQEAPQPPACCPLALHQSPPGFRTPWCCCPGFFCPCGSQLWQLLRGGRVLLLSRKLQDCGRHSQECTACSR